MVSQFLGLTHHLRFLGAKFRKVSLHAIRDDPELAKW